MRDRIVALVFALAVSGCAGNGPPAIRAGSPCVACGMSITDPGFACERRAARGWKQFDSIECLLRDAQADTGHAYLSDYDTHALHDADSMWVVRGSFPSPMGGGYAAFLARSAADDIAARTGGSVDRLGRFAAPGGAP